MASADKSDRTFSFAPATQSGKIPFTPPGTTLQCETAYWLWGELGPSTVPLIILHGGPAAPGRDFQPLADRLQSKYKVPVILYDQIGCGESTHLRDKKGDGAFWSFDLFFAELDNLKTHLGITTFDILGHSCGGTLGVPYAVTQPAGLRKLIVGSAVASDEMRVQALEQTRGTLPPEMQETLRVCEEEGRTQDPEYKKAGEEWFRRFFCRIEPMPKLMEEVGAYLEDDDTVSATLYGPPAKPTGTRKTWTSIPDLHRITRETVPGGVLLTNGKYDMVPEWAMQPFFARIRAPVKWVRFAESAHFPHLEELEAYCEALVDFLAMKMD